MPQISANNKTDSHDISDILCLTPLSSFQQYFSYIVPVSFIRGGNRSVSIQDQCLTRTMCNHRLLKYNIGINDLLFVTQSLVLCVCFVDRCLFLVPFVFLYLQFYVYVLQIVVCSFFLLAILFAVRRFTDSDPLGIFKLLLIS